MSDKNTRNGYSEELLQEKMLITQTGDSFLLPGDETKNKEANDSEANKENQCKKRHY